MSDQAENTAPVETTEVDTEVAATPGAGSAPDGTEAPASGDETSNWTEKAQKRYDELTRERYEAAARADRAEYRLQEAERRLAEREAAEAKTQTVAPSNDYPSLESVGYDEAKHREAVDAYYDRKFEAKAQSILLKKEQAAQRKQSEQAWERKEADFVKSRPDYVEKVIEGGRSGKWALSDEAYVVAQSIDNGPDVLLYLAENVEKSGEIYRLPPHLQAVELGRISTRLEAAKASPPPVSKAPPPAPTVNTAESSAPVSPDSAESDSKWDAEEWARRRNKQIEKRKG